MEEETTMRDKPLEDPGHHPSLSTEPDQETEKTFDGEENHSNHVGLEENNSNLVTLDDLDDSDDTTNPRVFINQEKDLPIPRSEPLEDSNQDQEISPLLDPINGESNPESVAIELDG